MVRILTETICINCRHTGKCDRCNGHRILGHMINDIEDAAIKFMRGELKEWIKTGKEASHDGVQGQSETEGR